MINKKKLLAANIVVLLYILVLVWSYKYDNKYLVNEPYGYNGSITITESDLQETIFLIDGWRINEEEQEYTYIGEYSNLSNGLNTDAHGERTYEMEINYIGKDAPITIDFPVIFTDFKLQIDEIEIESSGSANISFVLTEGQHLLTITTNSQYGFYSGIYHPPMLGMAQDVSSILTIRTIAYSFALVAGLIIFLYTSVLWKQSGDKVHLWYARLSIVFSAYLSYFFIRLLNIAYMEYWYVIQAILLYMMLYCTTNLLANAGNISSQTKVKNLINIQKVFGIILTVIAIGLNFIPNATSIHNNLSNIYAGYVVGIIIYLSIYSTAKHMTEYLYAYIASITCSIGLVCNIFYNNLFEPICFFWQFEWCIILVTIFFGIMMLEHNRRILEENIQFHQHLEQMVELRTIELTELLDERKLFFSHMSHDLKAPVYATQEFIRKIQENQIGMDQELLQYLEEVKIKQEEIEKKVTGLNKYNEIDMLDDKKTEIVIGQWLETIRSKYEMQAKVAAIVLEVHCSQPNTHINVAVSKLTTIFDNLIVNAMHATPNGGKIKIIATIGNGVCNFEVVDTGTGIDKEHLEHIFEKFFTTKTEEKSKSGIGLYVTKRLVDDLGGEISVYSQIPKGTTFYVDIPISNEKK